MTSDWIASVLTWAHILSGLFGSILIATAVGAPSDMENIAVFDVRGKKYPAAVIMSRRRFRWGLGLLVASFALQAFIQILRSR